MSPSASSGMPRPLARLRGIAFALLLLFSLPSLVPLVMAAQALVPGTGQSQLPACCRRNGAHHCTMSVAERAAVLGRTRAIRAPQQPCPFCPRQLACFPVGAVPLASPPRALTLTPPASHPRARAQVESCRRASEVRTRHGRGPPPALSLDRL